MNLLDKIADTRKTQEDEKRFYTFLKGCLKRLFLLLNTISENVSVFVSNDEHQHEETNKEANTTLPKETPSSNGCYEEQAGCGTPKKSFNDFQAARSKKELLQTIIKLMLIMFMSRAIKREKNNVLSFYLLLISSFLSFNIISTFIMKRVLA
ncbi:hypothetical protein BpHYR1_007926 [Brachionus plicatilis]|uniref:Uncharacterized protein n=1 Tax=Brachionus plicatilis TaxID=10195 RepID=A0A3M7QBU7_BRAPC|nr:hypothetical protein BpHYR1_007926 [Brachionus plicatilis]